MPQNSEFLQKNITRRQFVRGLTSRVAAASKASGAAGSLILNAYEPTGERCSTVRLGTLLLIDRHGHPYHVLPKVEAEGLVSVELPEGEFEMMMILPVRGFGQVYLYADNGGSLYQPQPAKMMLNYEFARSRAAFVRRYVKAAEAEGVGFSPAVNERLDRGEAMLAKATSTTDPPERGGLANDSLTDTMWAGEMAAFERAKHHISRNAPRPGFLFGCNAFDYAQSQQYARRYRELLNYGTIPFYRRHTERIEGHPDYSWSEAILAEMAGSGIMVKGHPLVWFHEASIPDFIRTKSWPELRQSAREYVLRTVSHFRSRIHAWDVINEAHDSANRLGFNHDQLLDLTRMAAETVALADPTAFRVINNCCTWGEYAAHGRLGCSANCNSLWTPFEYLSLVQDAGVNYDAIGLQLYNPVRDMLEIERHVERFFAFGKPVHITELEVASDTPSDPSFLELENPWHGTAWTPQVQADWVEQFYTICYSKPQVQAITWWDFADATYNDGTGELVAPFVQHGGFIDEKFEPKESYHRLKRLIQSWREMGASRPASAS